MNTTFNNYNAEIISKFNEAKQALNLLDKKHFDEDKALKIWDSFTYLDDVLLCVKTRKELYKCMISLSKLFSDNVEKEDSDSWFCGWICHNIDSSNKLYYIKDLTDEQCQQKTDKETEQFRYVKNSNNFSKRCRKDRNARLNELDEIIKDTKVEETKALVYFRLAQLNFEDPKKCKSLFFKAARMTRDAIVKKRAYKKATALFEPYKKMYEECRAAFENA